MSARERPKNTLPPLQERSRLTMERIIEAADHLLDGRSFSEISIDEIINSAEVSRSSFYARFPTKESLLPALFESHLTRGRDALKAATELDPSSIAPRDLIELLVGSYLEFLRKFQAPISTFDSSSIPGIDQLQTEVIGHVVNLYLACVDQTDNEFLPSQVVFACRAVGSIMLRALAPPVEFAKVLGFSDERLRDETVQMVVAYLEAACEKAASPPQR